MKSTGPVVGLALAAFLAAGCGGNDPRLNSGGSTFVYPMMIKWTRVYDQQKGVKVDYQSTGSGNGIQQTIAQTIDFGCTDAPLNQEQMDKARSIGGEVLHLPLVLGAVVPAYNLPQPDGSQPALRFTGPVLADIFLGKIAKWNGPALAELNPGVYLPDREIVVVHRSDGSGTTYLWVDYLSKVSAEWKSKVGVGTSVKWPRGVGQRGNEGVSGHVGRSPGSLGYLSLDFALETGISVGSVRNRAGKFIPPTFQSVTVAANNSLDVIPDDLRFSITDAPGEDSYPVSGAVWAVLYRNQPAARAQLLVDFLSWVTHDGQQYCEPLHYAPLPPALVQRVEKKLDEILTIP